MRPQTPLWDALQKHIISGLYPFHVPGHKSGRGLPTSYVNSLINYDLTELSGLDNLYDPSGPIARAQELTAQLFGVAATLFTTNGSTAGLIAAVLACCPSGGTIILPRNAHVSLLHACVLGDLSPVFVDVEIDPYTEIPLGLTPEQLSIVLESSGADAVVAVYPTYHGVCGDIRGIGEVCRQAGIRLIVDEAHGTHLYLNPSGPVSSLCTEASVVVQSAHKTGLALTGAAWVHIKDQSLVQRVKASLRLVQSTSPSYLLLSSLDITRAIMEEEGPRLMRRALAAADKLASILPLYKPPWPYRSDPLRLVINARQLGISGQYLAARFLAHGVAAEMFDLYSVTLVLSLADDEDSVAGLTAAFQQIERQPTGPPLAPVCPPLGQQVLTPRQAHFSPKRSCKLEQSKGFIAAEAVTTYPPGIPVVWPGQIITTEILEYLASRRALGAEFSGISAQGEVLVRAEVEND
ncbi:MAG: aminotransferase class I/II-fold pyridoxal phosphate-dependent enzyme [Peptococcaceae bacterium]|nr:aminotransferase class I/II-fold pyridoxal phosphate-dependent enzyme [Peptococcaceae bacterium]